MSIEWVPGHCVIPGNELADQTAKEPSFIHIHSHSFYCIKKSMQYNNTNRRNTDTTGTELIEGLSLNSIVNYSLEI